MDNRKLLGLSGLLKSAKHIRCIKDVALPLCIAICLSVMLMLGGVSPFIVLGKICDMTISITSTLLSFSLAGYTLLVGLNPISTLKPKYNQKNEENDDVGLYEKVNIAFSLYLLMQVLILFFSVIVGILIISPTSFLSEPFPNIINYIGVVILLAPFFYEVLLLEDLIIIIYNYSLFRKHREEDSSQ